MVGYISLAPGTTLEQAKALAENVSSINSAQLSTAISTTPVNNIQQNITNVSTTLNTVVQNITNVTASITSGAGLASIGTGIASSLTGSITGSLPAGLSGVASGLTGASVAGLATGLASSFPVLGASFALSSALSNITSFLSSGDAQNPQTLSHIPMAAKGLVSNGPTTPQGFSIGAAGDINIADTQAAAIAGLRNIFSILPTQS